MYTLKPIGRDAVPAALEKAEHYRLLNDSAAAESICRDVLEIDPENQTALVNLLLAITDQFDDRMEERTRRAREVLPRLRDEYKRFYYAGIICERRAKAQLRNGTLGGGEMAYDSLHDAMGWYERAEALRPAGNDESILRWNTCARILMSNPHLRQRPEERFEPAVGE
jgi:hypothetical protein